MSEIKLGPNEYLNSLRESYFRYYETPFRLRNESLNRERRDLLDVPGGVWQTPLLEYRDQYLTDHKPTSESLRNTVSGDLSDLASVGLVRGFASLYKHQVQALEASTSGLDFVVTAGTGSGKTETFLLPILASLLNESTNWTSNPPTPNNWWMRQDEWCPTFQNYGQDRHRAVRTMILYPMNALVDDQLVRLRKALDSDEVHAWLDENRNGHRFHFGRYTGGTPVLGGTGNPMARAKLKDLYGNWDRIRQSATHHDSESFLVSGEDPETRFQVPRLDGAEVLSRWDMLSTPPDIMITNYSMLNIMLMRPRDSVFFEETKKWLETDPRNVFTLVVDELHMYRGTAGTEIALLLRNLRSRLGLKDQPRRFKVIAASASLDVERDQNFIQTFFDKDDSFVFIAGEKVVPQPIDLPLLVPVSPLVDILELKEDEIADHAHKLFKKFELDRALATAFNSETTSSSLTIEELSTELFGDASDAHTATLGILKALPYLEGLSNTRLRAHFFFRNVPGIWACTSSFCPSLPDTRNENLGFGRLLNHPSSRCPDAKCNSRVLEFLYCQDCGDSFLGGFSPTDPNSQSGGPISLLPDASEIEKLPDAGQTDRNSENYVIYWPSTSSIDPDDRSWRIGNYDYGWIPCRIDPHLGEIQDHPELPTGWRFVSRKRVASSVSDANWPAFPTKCPNCSSDWETTYSAKSGPIRATDKARLRSPIRTMRTGFEKINQVLISELIEYMDSQKRSVIAFSDSRQDAAKLSAGISLRHYQDLIRQIFFEEVSDTGVPKELQNFLSSPSPITFTDVIDILSQGARQLASELLISPENLELKDKLLKSFEFPEKRITEIEVPVMSRLLTLGMNPGGPKPSIQKVKGKYGKNWASLIEKASKGFNWRTFPALSVDEKDLKNDIISNFKEEFYLSIAGSAGRDLESIGLGWLCDINDTEPVDCDTNSDHAIIRVSIRILTLMQRIEGLRSGRVAPPAKLKDFWLAIDKHRDLAEGTTQIRAMNLLQNQNSVVSEFLVKPLFLKFRTSDKCWTCAQCRQKHQVFGVGLCTRCFQPLIISNFSTNSISDEDFYAWKVLNNRGKFRLNSAELTGQTSRESSQDRQLRFQDVFLEDEEIYRHFNGLELLSVTTTMEAGVDIGQLNTVVMSNMPPSRFNYQQRVGRAGRRGNPLAISLTICRGRSHDDLYFNDPKAITSSPTPPPYLTLSQERIIRRVLISEVLRRAFAFAVESSNLEIDAMDTHGPFGTIHDWTTLRSFVQSWIATNMKDLVEISEIIRGNTNFSEADTLFASEELIGIIDQVADLDHGPDSLSERLANRGLMPMFGFPTQVRYLYLHRPSSSYPWPPNSSINRDASLAITQFAPNSEVVRDGKVYTVGGIGAFTPTGGKNRPATIPDALGNRRDVYMCRACSLLEDINPEVLERLTCPSCGATSPEFSPVQLREPLGYISTESRDFDGNFTWTSRSGSARATADFKSLSAQTSNSGIKVFSGLGERFSINDNSGGYYAFEDCRPNSHWDGAMEVREKRSDEPAIALASVQFTDILFLSPPDQISCREDRDFNIRSCVQTYEDIRDPNLGLKASWYSLAFLMRNAAASLLDLQPMEFAAGIHVGKIEQSETNTRAFLADVLENGAGFSTQLGTHQLEDFVKSMRETISKWQQADHAERCQSSCYDCMRDYNNMSYHPLLDWRLGEDMINAFENTFEVNEQRIHVALGTLSKSLVGSSIISNDGFLTIERNGRSVAVLGRHPLEPFNTSKIAPRLYQIAESALSSGVDYVVACDYYTIDRLPRTALKFADMAFALNSNVS